MRCYQDVAVAVGVDVSCDADAVAAAAAFWLHVAIVGNGAGAQGVAAKCRAVAGGRQTAGRGITGSPDLLRY